MLLSQIVCFVKKIDPISKGNIAVDKLFVKKISCKIDLKKYQFLLSSVEPIPPCLTSSDSAPSAIVYVTDTP